MELNFRKATQADIPEIIRLLSEDKLGGTREIVSNPPQSYYDAFSEIGIDPNNELIVCEKDNAVIGCLQLTFIPSMTFQGGKRAQIEGVRIDQRYRSQGYGRMLFEWAIGRAREKHCRFVQLTTNKSRPEAHQFYFNLGFIASHEGMKLDLAI